MLAGQVGDEAVLIARAGGRPFYAVGAECTHYSGPLADGLVVGDTVRCPYHHAGFSLKTGKALAAPAIDAIACWIVEEADGKAFVRAKQGPAAPAKPAGGAVRGW